MDHKDNSEGILKGVSITMNATGQLPFLLLKSCIFVINITASNVIKECNIIQCAELLNAMVSCSIK